MHLSLHEATKADIAEWVTTAHDASLTPPKPGLWIAVAPQPSFSAPERREREIASTIRRFESSGTWDLPGGFHLKVVDDDDNGKIVAGGFYTLHEDAPSGAVEGIIATWHPEGGQRDFVSKSLQQMERPRRAHMNCPHLVMRTLFTLPEYRRCGAASMCVQDMVSVADEKGLPCWLTSTDLAKPLYEKYGFVAVGTDELRPEPTDKAMEESDGWQFIKRQTQGARFTYMLRSIRASASV